MSELSIVDVSCYTASVEGGKKMILCCEKVTKEDVQIRFYEEQNEQIVWEGFGQFHPSQVHKQVYNFCNSTITAHCITYLSNGNFRSKFCDISITDQAQRIIELFIIVWRHEHLKSYCY